MKTANLTAALAALIMVCACTEKHARWHIGISQCSEDIWRDWQNAEMKLESSLHHDVHLSFATARDDSRLQSQQIDSLVATGIDLLIVAPNQLQSVSPAIDRAFDSGLPVIVFERKTISQKYTAFVSADNYEMGRQMAMYIAACTGGKGRIMEVMGLKGSSPADERHRGFHDGINLYPDMHVAASLHGDWTEATARNTVDDYLTRHPADTFDIVFGHNDRTAIGARHAFTTHRSSSSTPAAPLPLFCGIDGLPGADGGIRQVRDSLLTASYIYPTRGDLLLQLAIDILEGRPYAKETLLTSALVTPENANVLYLESEEVVRRSQRLERLKLMADGYLRQLTAQRTVSVLACSVLALLAVALLLFYLYHRGQMNIRRERVLNNLWNLSTATEIPGVTSPTSAEGGNTVQTTDVPDASPSGPSATEAIPHHIPEDGNPNSASSRPPSTISPPQQEGRSELHNVEGAATPSAISSLFIQRFREVVERRMTDSELSVEDLAADMNLSRVQLYRKVKAISGSSPVELLRTARLNRGYQLLLTTDKTVAEVAYAVGFSAPAYFTKCFKEEFGTLPGDLRK